MNAIVTRRIKARQRRLARRLDRFNFPENLGEPVMRARNIRFELAERDLSPNGVLASDLTERLPAAERHP